MRIKVCGITKTEQLHQLHEAGVDFAGFIFLDSSPRDVIKSGLSAAEVKHTKNKPYTVGVFVNATYEFIMQQIEAFGLDMVQLHGGESPYFCERISNNIQAIKAFRFSGNDHVEWILKDYYDAADMFMLDTGTITRNAETGIYNQRNFDYKLIKDVQLSKPFFLSGGIEPNDTDKIHSFMQLPVASKLFCVDINSRFEIVPGIKDIDAIKRFKEALIK